MENFAEIYETMLGFRTPEACVPGVEDAFASGNMTGCAVPMTALYPSGRRGRGPGPKHHGRRYGSHPEGPVQTDVPLRSNKEMIVYRTIRRISPHATINIIYIPNNS